MNSFHSVGSFAVLSLSTFSGHTNTKAFISTPVTQRNLYYLKLYNQIFSFMISVLTFTQVFILYVPVIEIKYLLFY